MCILILLSLFLSNSLSAHDNGLSVTVSSDSIVSDSVPDPGLNQAEMPLTPSDTESFDSQAVSSDSIVSDSVPDPGLNAPQTPLIPCESTSHAASFAGSPYLKNTPLASPDNEVLHHQGAAKRTVHFDNHVTRFSAPCFSSSSSVWSSASSALVPGVEDKSPPAQDRKLELPADLVDEDLSSPTRSSSSSSSWNKLFPEEQVLTIMRQREKERAVKEDMQKRREENSEKSPTPQDSGSSCGSAQSSELVLDEALLGSSEDAKTPCMERAISSNRDLFANARQPKAAVAVESPDSQKRRPVSAL
ncbi:MAG: hypothetical protein Q8K36_00565, partial [Alphaproteobacteria bacterium]|nr:hypothetical protein [Alphaproteobacteria bacterium]